MTSLPEKIDCFVADGGNPVKDLMLRAEFQTIRKNPYTVIFGPTNRNGYAYLDRATISQQANSQLNLALMDFEPLDKAFTGIVRIAIMQKSDVQNALRAYEIFKSVANFTDHYEDDLKSALVAMRHTEAHKLNVSAKVEPASITVHLT